MPDDLEYLERVVKSAGYGWFIELGVSSGKSLRVIKKHAKGPVVGFDWFRGLPEPWDVGDCIHPTGMFRANVPCDLAGLLVVGKIEDTLKPWLDSHDAPISFVHFDMDLYGPTKFALDALTGRITKGCVLAFDELTQQEGCKWFSKWREHEYRALTEWLAFTGKTVRQIASDGVTAVAFVVE